MSCILCRFSLVLDVVGFRSSNALYLFDHPTGDGDVREQTFVCSRGMRSLSTVMVGASVRLDAGAVLHACMHAMHEF